MEFEIADNNNSLKILILELMYPDADLDWDRNMLKGRIIINAGTFIGDYIAEIATFDLIALKEGLLALYNNLSGAFNFETIERHLSININGDGLGHFICDCIANDDPGVDGTELKFNLFFDQTWINDFVKQLDLITNAYPLIGNLKMNK